MKMFLVYLTYIEESITPIYTNSWSVYEIANQSFDAMQNTIARQKLIDYPPNVIVNISRDACGTLEFNRAKEMIDLGYAKIKQELTKHIS